MLIALFLIAKLFVVQVVHGEDYRLEAERQYVSPAAGVFNRGSIYFTEHDGLKVSAATIKTGVAIAINPSVLVDPEDAYKKLSAIIDIDHDSFFAKASKKDDPYEIIATQQSTNIGDRIRDLKIDGVIVVKDKWRFYPAGSTGAQVIGFVGYKGNELTGRYGLERYYNETLSRDDPSLYVNFFAEIFSNISSTLLSESNEREGDIVTSIEPTVQSFLETELQKITDEWHADHVGGIIIDPKTGEIFAMGQAPTFDPNKFNEVNDQSVFANSLVENVYEMGSIIKALTMAAGLDAGAVKAATTYDDVGTRIIDGKRISNYDGRARGVVPMQQVLDQSLNMGAVFVMEQLGEDQFRKYMLNYGLGEETGVDLPGEVHGFVSNLNSNREVEYATASFGQGIALTPIATVRALSSLANGGFLISPHVTKEIDYTGIGTHTVSPLPPKRVLKSSTSEEITRMLIKVVDDALLGGTVALPHYSIAAKTGTAQIANPNGGGYYTDRYLHSFFGYFPAYNPRFLVFLFAVNPKGARYASHTLTMPFMDITKFLINYYDVPPDR